MQRCTRLQAAEGIVEDMLVARLVILHEEAIYRGIHADIIV